jgi:hypothetical protein
MHTVYQNAAQSTSGLRYVLHTAIMPVDIFMTVRIIVCIVERKFDEKVTKLPFLKHILRMSGALYEHLEASASLDGWQRKRTPRAPSAQSTTHAR